MVQTTHVLYIIIKNNQNINNHRMFDLSNGSFKQDT